MPAHTVPPEVASRIVRNVACKSELATLSAVSRAFQAPAERALYNILHMREASTAVALCNILSATPRVAGLVDALALFVGDDEDEEEDESDFGSSDEADSDDEEFSIPVPLPDGFWDAVAGALCATDKLRFLNIYLGNVDSSAHAYILRDTTFSLHTFHCDLQWDADLARFLATQDSLADLCIADFPYRPSSPLSITSSDLDRPGTAHSSGSAGTIRPPGRGQPPPTPTSTTSRAFAAPRSTSPLLPPALPALTLLECTFTEAARALVPTRPVSHVKTVLSRSSAEGKHAELARLAHALAQSSVPLRALDVADGTYLFQDTETLLNAVLHAGVRLGELRYLGTVVLPVNGTNRLQLYGLLRRLPLLAVELEVTEWSPALRSSRALKAVAAELQLYVHGLRTVVFVRNVTRTIVRLKPGGFARIDFDSSPDGVWREV